MELEMRHLVWLTLLIFAVGFVSPVVAQEDKAQDDPVVQKEDADESSEEVAGEKEKKPETVEVVKKPIRVFKTMSGLLESQNILEVETNFESWTDLKIKTVAKQGKVAQGDVLVELDTESIDKAITEAEFGLRSAQFSQQLARLEAQKSAQSFELENAIAELSWRSAQEDNQYYKDITVPQREKDLEYDEKSAGYYLEYANDELDQLLQMYTEDDLTEESEAIVLKRAKRSVESAERQRDRSMRRIERNRKYEIARSDQREEHSFAKSRMEFEKSKVVLPIEKEKSEIAMAKADFEFSQKEKALKELLEDRAKMTIKAETGGILFYGECDRGKWTSSGNGGRDLEKDSKLPAKAVVMTIVDAGQMNIRASVEEADLSSFAAGLSGKAKFEAVDGKIVPCAIDSIDRIPLDDGKYDCKVTMQGVPADINLVPGMGCKMSFLAYVNNDATVVPKASVFSDDDGFTHYVYLASEEGEPQKVDVVVGKTSGDDIEILQGLSVGDQIAKKKP
jgi:multidrug efflux pump subunit AcrA (membrane-fusion protein)